MTIKSTVLCAVHEKGVITDVEKKTVLASVRLRFLCGVAKANALHGKTAE